MRASVVLEGLELPLDLGTYAPGAVVPDHHMLDLELTIDPALVQVSGDGMEHVFDYDPLIAQIDALARDGHYETQEWLITRIAVACAGHKEISQAAIRLSKRPVFRAPDGANSGSLGIRLELDRAEMDRLISPHRPDH